MDIFIIEILLGGAVLAAIAVFFLVEAVRYARTAKTSQRGSQTIIIAIGFTVAFGGALYGALVLMNALLLALS